MLRRLIIPLVLSGLAVSAGKASADVQSYCEVYSKDFADIRTSDVDQWQLIYRSAFNDCMVGYNTEPRPEGTTAPVASLPDAGSEQDAAAAQDNVTTGVAPAPPVAAKPRKKAKPVLTRTVAKKVTVKPAPAASKGKNTAQALVPGSDAWNSYCAGKYSSFNPLSGTYLSNSGKIRRCR